MQKKYSVTGNLYWATTIFQKYTRNGYVYRDLWNDPLSWAANNPTNGDGFLVYPGKDYGVYGPISTIRLESIREGMEDYEYLYLLESLLNQRMEKYGVDVALNEYVGYLYDMLFSGTIANTDVRNLEFARREVASLITALANENAPIIISSGVNAKTGKNTVIVYSNEPTIKVNGQSITTAVNCGEGYKFTVSVSTSDSLNYVNVEVGGKTYSKFIGTKTTLLNAFDNESEVGKVTTSKFGSANDTEATLNQNREYIFGGEGSLKVQLTPAGNASYFRNISIDVSQNGKYVDMSKINNVYLNVYNGSDKNLTFYMAFIDKNGLSYSANTFLIKAGERKTVSVNILKVESIDFSNIAKVQILFPEIRTASGFESPFDMYFDNMYFDYAI
jgi:hypothetical protein